MKIRDKKNRPKISPNSGAIIALTGNIGTGKSFVRDEFEKKDYLVFNSDLEAKKILQKSNEIKRILKGKHSEVVVNEEIDFQKLSDLAFSDPEILSIIGTYSHKKLRQLQADFIEQHPNRTIIFEIPLLFENKRDAYFDYIIATHADKKTIMKRVLARKGMTESKFHAIIAKQKKINHTDPRVDFHIDTSQGDDFTRIQIRKIFDGS